MFLQLKFLSAFKLMHGKATDQMPAASTGKTTPPLPSKVCQVSTVRLNTEPSHSLLNSRIYTPGSGLCGPVHSVFFQTAKCQCLEIIDAARECY